MIFFEQPTPQGIIFAKKRHADESISVIATCEPSRDKPPEATNSWDVRGDKHNSVSKIAIAQALALAYAAQWHCCVIMDLLTIKKAEVLTKQD